MIFELILALLLGILAGTFTGLSPGIHINLVAAILLSSLSLFAGVPPLALVVFIVSMSITHTFVDFIPSVYLGAPQEDTMLSILPGHELLKEGKGHEAIVLALYGSLSALAIIILATPIYIFILPSLYPLLKTAMPFILIFISIYLIFREEEILISLVVFFLTGFLGLFTFNLPVKEPLFPLLTGLFGASAIIISLKDKISIKKQTISPMKNIRLTKKEFSRATLAAGLAGPLCSFLPGIGSGHAAVIGSELIPQERKGFLFLTGAISTIVMALSFVTLYTINKTRSGSSAAIQEILKSISLPNLLIIILAVILSGLVAFILSVNLSKICSNLFNKINYSLLNIFVLSLLFILTLIFSNPLGILVLITSTSLGIYAILSGSRRINLMGSLIIPAIVYYLTN